jgi:ankyrin repeat protein
VYAEDPEIDRPVMAAVRRMTLAELSSAERGHRPPQVRLLDLVAALATRDDDVANRLWNENPRGSQAGGPYAGVLHLMVKRGDGRAVRWLLDRGADPNALWAHWEADVTPLHLAAMVGHADVARALLAAGADRTIRDNKHDSVPLGWAEFFGRIEIVRLLGSATS